MTKVLEMRKEIRSTFCICQKIWLLKNMPKYVKFDKYAKPKIFMPTTSKNCQISKIWHKICQLTTLCPNEYYVSLAL